jgi:D-alanyl-D-alanine carboxypeptidase
MTVRHLLITLFLATSTLAQPAVPDSPAGRVFAAWLAAFNSADPARIRAFDETHRREARPIEQTLGMRDMTGGFTLVRIEKSEPLSIVALLQEKNSDTIGRLELSVSSDEPPKIVSSPLRAIPRPPDLALPRLPEGDAVAALAARADELAREDRFSGALLVARNGKVLLQKAWGTANREAGTPLSVDTQFRLGSMNKMFTATAAMQLVEAGRLALDDPIGKYLSDYSNKEVASKVTVRHLLTHTGGTGDIFGPEFTKNRLTLREHGDYVKLYGERSLVHEPGAEWRYSNYGFVLLGALIEKVSGMPYYDYVRTKVFQPAGMSSTDSLAETEKVPSRATGYMKRDGGWRSNADTLPWRGTAAGGGYSTVADLFRFAQALESGKLISKAMLAEATRPQRQQYGFGFGVQGEGPLRSYGHGGGAPGMNGDLRIYPELGYVLVGLSNFDPPAASRLVDFFALRMPATPPGTKTLPDAWHPR